MRVQFTALLTISYLMTWAQSEATLSGEVRNQQGTLLEDVLIYLEDDQLLGKTNASGFFSVDLVLNSTYDLSFQGIQIEPLYQTIFLKSDTSLLILVEERVQNLEEVVIVSEADAFGIRQLRSIEAGGLYEGKKSEVINVERLITNKATNNARQAFSKIPSLNIWESDYAGLQLDIGGRGLSPKRTSNFNTRQNGYDISADALGYPESYYTPPLQAVDRIEIVRGAGALQYGSQFGGLVNFRMKEGDESRPLGIESQNSYGAYQFFNTFNVIEGQAGPLNHYSYFQYKRGDGWRPNSAFDQYSASTNLKLQMSEGLKLGVEFTHMHYLSQQAGGLTDQDFRDDPQMSTRSRNWFKVNWTLPALLVEYHRSSNFKIYNKTFGLIAQRSSLGLLTTPDLDDPAVPGEPLDHRDLIDGKFRNIGNETRVVINYGNRNRYHSLLIGTRLYRGFTNFRQQLGDAGTDPNFMIVDTVLLDRRKSDFDFPSFNGALFLEGIVRLNETFSLIPGIRYEHIYTRSEGALMIPVRTSSFGDVIEQTTYDTTDNRRNILLYGLGLSKKFKERYELYANATANYRAINFTDVQIQTNTQLVDTLIRDESGYSFDLGVRKLSFDPFFLEAGLFYLQYDNRIGEVIDDGLRVRTNIGSARIFGVECFFEVDVLKALRKRSEHTISLFINGSLNQGTYTKINERALSSVRSGNRLEDIPEYSIKAGIVYGYRKFSMSLQSTFVGEQYSDAANTEVVFNALNQPNGVFGEIPSYSVFDFSAKYTFSDRFRLSCSVNNLFDQAYFTRRATAYPGPGIIPALGRTWNFTLSINI